MTEAQLTTIGLEPSLEVLKKRIEESAFYSLIERTGHGIAILKGDRCVYANSAFIHLLGKGSASPFGADFFLLVHADDRAALKRLLDGTPPEVKQPLAAAKPVDSLEAIDQKEEPKQEQRSFRLVGTPRAPVIIELIEVERIEVAGVPLDLVVTRDVSEVRRVHARMLLADRMMSVGTLAAGVGHEINNPLSYVIGNLSYIAEEIPELAKKAGLESTELLEALEEARQGAERVRQIVRDLQAFSRADHQSSPSVDVRRTIELAINMAWIEIRHRARLIKDFDEVPAVEASEARLGQVFLSLLLHTAHALPEGSADKHQIRIATAAEPGGGVTVEISHTGPSLAAQLARHIVDPFFDQGAPGTGLGLAIAHTIVADLGGDISVENNGVGSAFRVHLPPAVQASAQANAARPGSNVGHGRVLIVDDEPLLANSLRRSLRDHEVTVVESGKQAIKLLSSDEFDLVLCDLMMPEMTGMDVYDWLRSARPGAEKRMVFMTGGTFTPRAAEFLKTVTNHRFEKPFELEKMREFVRAYITRGRGA